MARRRKKTQKTRRCQWCSQIFVLDHAGRVRQRCPFCNRLNSKPKTKGQLEQRADKLFSRLVRFCRADKQGYVHCCTCSTRKPWTEVDNGHYMSRSFRATRWDWENCWPQCKPCNCGFGTLHWKPDESVKLAYTTFLDMQLGEGAAESIWKRAMDPDYTRPTNDELQDLIWTFQSQCQLEGLPTT